MQVFIKIKNAGKHREKYRYECKELIEKGRCDKGFIWNFSKCQWECDKSCFIGE